MANWYARLVLLANGTELCPLKSALFHSFRFFRRKPCSSFVFLSDWGPFPLLKWLFVWVQSFNRQFSGWTWGPMLRSVAPEVDIRAHCYWPAAAAAPFRARHSFSSVTSFFSSPLFCLSPSFPSMEDLLIKSFVAAFELIIWLSSLSLPLHE